MSWNYYLDRLGLVGAQRERVLTRLEELERVAPGLPGLQRVDRAIDETLAPPPQTAVVSANPD